MKSFFGPDAFPGRWSVQKRLSYDWRPVESGQGMPLGTGRTGAMIWAQDMLNLQLSHTDSWSEDGNLLSMLRVKIEFTHPITSILSFRQELDLDSGSIGLSYSTASGMVKVEIHAHRKEDLFEVLIHDERAHKDHIRVIPQFWRPSIQPLVRKKGVFFLEENRYSAFADLNRNTGVATIGELVDPLLGRVRCTGIILEKGIPDGPLCPSYQSSEIGEHRILICCRCSSSDSAREVMEQIESVMQKGLASDTDTMSQQDKTFWRGFWEKSSIHVPQDSPFLPVHATWHLHRFFCACSMEGESIPKFNGSIFLFEGDRRYWGGAYWFQNTRLMYWPLMKSGDWEFLPKFFAMYERALEFAKMRVQNAYDHSGAIFLETMHPWGAGRWEDVTKGKVTNPYIQNYFGGSLELIRMVIDFFRYHKDTAFIDRILTIAYPVVQFFWEHFPKKEGKVFFHHSAALETWWDVDQPADQIAGLRSILQELSPMAKSHGKTDMAFFFEDVLHRLPHLPRGRMRYENGQVLEPDSGRDFLPAQRFYHPSKENYEDPELYAIWPYRLLGTGLPEYEDALTTFHHRIHKEPKYGWSQTAIWAARLGLAQEATRLILEHFDESASFPGGMMASPGYSLGGQPKITDCAYFDAPGAISIALMEMLLQEREDRAFLFPAWPADQKVGFRLHLPSGIVEAEN